MDNVILVGNPNTGKTTLYNNLTKSSEHTGNWHGVTVDEKTKKTSHKNTEFLVCDLPGIYSLTPLTFEEKVAVDFLYSHQNSLIVNVVDVNNLSRNLLLSLDLVELIMAFEDEFSLSISDEEAESIRTVGDAVAYIKSHA